MCLWLINFPEKIFLIYQICVFFRIWQFHLFFLIRKTWLHLIDRSKGKASFDLKYWGFVALKGILNVVFSAECVWSRNKWNWSWWNIFIILFLLFHSLFFETSIIRKWVFLEVNVFAKELQQFIHSVWRETLIFFFSKLVLISIFDNINMILFFIILFGYTYLSLLTLFS